MITNSNQNVVDLWWEVRVQEPGDLTAYTVGPSYSKQDDAEFALEHRVKPRMGRGGAGYRGAKYTKATRFFMVRIWKVEEVICES